MAQPVNSLILGSSSERSRVPRGSTYSSTSQLEGYSSCVLLCWGYLPPERLGSGPFSTPRLLASISSLSPKGS